MDDPLVKEAADLEVAMEKLIEANQELGAKIDAIRDERRKLIREITRIQARRAMITLAISNDAVRNAVVEGQTVVATGSEVLDMIARARST